jgi:transposase
MRLAGRNLKRGSCKDRRMKLRRARLSAREARQRRETLHLWTTGIARRFARLAIKSPPLAEATKSGHGDAWQHGAMTDFKAALNRRVLDQAPGYAIQMLRYKIAERGGETELMELPDADVMTGNLVVQAAKTNRKLKRTAHAHRPA